MNQCLVCALAHPDVGEELLRQGLRLRVLRERYAGGVDPNALGGKIGHHQAYCLHHSWRCTARVALHQDAVILPFGNR